MKVELEDGCTIYTPLHIIAADDPCIVLGSQAVHSACHVSPIGELTVNKSLMTLIDFDHNVDAQPLLAPLMHSQDALT